MAKRLVRLDRELVDQGFFASTDEAMRAVLAGQVHNESQLLTQPGLQVRPGAFLSVKNQKRYVSRGGKKLEGALREFGLSVLGLSCLDIGCSTGGFTDCLLQNGAARVCAVDVGYGQFDWSLRTDERVALFERTNICDTTPERLGGPFDLAVADVSFTSIEHILDATERLLTDEGIFLSLVKPQFEAEKEDVGAGGVVRDPRVHLAVLRKVVEVFSGRSLKVRGLCVSSIKGPKGNIEFFVLTAKGGAVAQRELDVEAIVSRAWER